MHASSGGGAAAGGEEPEHVKVAYWPGCVSRGFTPELHGSMAQVAPLLDIELVELDRAACCGAGVIAEHNQELADTLNARTFALAQQVQGAELMMNICSTCQGAQSECQERLDANTDYREHVNELLAGESLRYERGLTNKHFLWLMVEEIGLDAIAAKVTRPLTDLRVGPFYGCYIVRPSDRLGIDARAPARHLPAPAHRGARRHGGRLRRPVQVLRLPHHHDGAGRTRSSRPAGTSATRSTRTPTASSPRARSATSTSTSSSRWPRRWSGGSSGMPVLHLPQLVGLAFGLDPKELGLGKHVVKPTSVIDWSTSVVAGVG